MLYTAKDLLEVSKTSLQSINKLFKSNSELRELATEHRIVKNRNVFYDEIIYEWFCNRYGKQKNKDGVEDGEGIGENKTKGANRPLLTAPTNDDELRQITEEKERLLAELKEMKDKYETIQTAFKGKDGEIEHLKRENQALQANFEKANGELDDLKRENGFKSEEIQRLLLIIQQEKQEKAQIMLMLPPPRKSIGEKIKALFTRKDTPLKGV